MLHTQCYNFNLTFCCNSVEMASNRLEKIGTIYSRTKGLMAAKALSWNDRPLWYDIYEAFPPKEVPTYDRKAPDIPLKKIFYKEDKVRALFQKNFKNLGATNLTDSKHESMTQRFLKTYEKLEKQYGDDTSLEQIYNEAVDMFLKERESTTRSFSNIFKSAESESQGNVKINLGNIMKE